MGQNFNGLKILTIPRSHSIKAEVAIPGSKSLTNRAFLLACLAQGESSLGNVLESDDTIFMRAACERLGAKIEKLNSYTYCIEGIGGNIRQVNEPIYIENAGTAARFLTAILPFGSGIYELTGNARMCERPIADLVDALRVLGANIFYKQKPGSLPLVIHSGLKKIEHIVVPCEKSSQYISALLQAAPLMKGELHIELIGDLVSKTYVDMTIEVMQKFGVRVDWPQKNHLFVKAGQAYKGCHFEIEADASSASYFFAAAAITGGEVTINGIFRNSTQGDLGFLQILEAMGSQIEWKNDFQVTLKGPPTLKAVSVDMNTMSDVALTLAAVAVFAQGDTHIRNVANMRLKECDRIEALSAELKRAGVDVIEYEDGLTIRGGQGLRSTTFETYGDHRMAMALSLIGLKQEGIAIANPECVSKTFPDFFNLLFSILKN